MADLIPIIVETNKNLGDKNTIQNLKIGDTDYTITVEKLDDKTYFGQCNEEPGAIVECSSIDEVMAEMAYLIPEIIEANKLLGINRKKIE